MIEQLKKNNIDLKYDFIEKYPQLYFKMILSDFRIEKYDENLIINIKSKDGEYIVDIGAKLFELFDHHNKNIFEFLKTMPADSLLNIEKCVEVLFRYENFNGVWKEKTKTLGSDFDLGTNSHQLGHSVAYMLDLKNDKKLKEIYEKELNNFNNRYCNETRKDFYYFSEVGGKPYVNTGFEELIAETNMLLTIPYHKDEKVIKICWLLAHNFPETISYIASCFNLNAV